MFTKLRNRFLIVNMLITSMVIAAAFVTIYFITYNNIHLEIQNRLSSQAGMQISIDETSPPDNTEKRRITSSEQKSSLNGPPSFSIEVDAKGNIQQIDSSIDMPDTAYQTAAETAWGNKKDSTAITLDGKQWLYCINPVNIIVIGKNGQQLDSSEAMYNIVFLDVTEYNKTLFELLTTLLLVGLITLLVIFAISLYFANQSIKPIAEAWRKQKQFVADASHELKTPLSIINANYDALLANKDETIKSQLKWLGYIRIGTDRMTKLVNDLLSLAKIEDVNLETQKISFNISGTINDVMSSMEAAVMEKGITLSNSIEPDIIIKSDPEKVKQVIMILFDNAIKYTNENGQICIALKKSKRQVIYSIRNSGKGISKQDLPRVFDRFFRADPSRAHENGSYGLGLSIAKAIIDRLGGEIHVKSVENEFTTFTFTLGLYR